MNLSNEIISSKNKQNTKYYPKSRNELMIKYNTSTQLSILELVFIFCFYNNQTFIETEDQK